jgi:hypothetical protein
MTRGFGAQLVQTAVMAMGYEGSRLPTATAWAPAPIFDNDFHLREALADH